MLWQPKSLLEAEGRPTRREMFFALVGIPAFLAYIIVFSVRIYRGFRGEPLTISSRLNIEVQLTGDFWYFSAGIALYFMLITLFVLMLWACALQCQRWLYWRCRV